MQPPKSIAIEEIGMASDSVAYTLAYFKGFPPEDNMTLAKALRRVVSHIESALRCNTSPTAQQWLNYSLRELATAQGIAADEESDVLGNILSDVRDYLENAMSDKGHSANFISSPDGQLRKTDDPA